MEQSRLDLMDMIREYCPEVKVQAWAEDSGRALDLLRDMQPDIAFLDLSLRGINVMELLQHIDLSHTSVIIVTGSETVDKKVVRPETVAYLNKPVNPAELISAVKLVSRSRQNTMTGLNPDRLKITNKHGQHLIDLSGLIKLVADNNRTLVYCTKYPEPISTSRTLKKFDFLEERDEFCRIHNSYLINLGYVRKYHVTEGGWVSLSDGSSLSISRNNLSKFLAKIERYIVVE